MHLLASFPSLVLVVIMQNLHLSMKAVRPSTFSCNEGSSRFFCLYGSAGWLPVSVLEYDILVLCVLVELSLCCCELVKREVVSGDDAA